MYYLSKNQASSLYGPYELPKITGIETLVAHFFSSRKALGSSRLAWHGQTETLSEPQVVFEFCRPGGVIQKHTAHLNPNSHTT